MYAHENVKSAIKFHIHVESSEPILEEFKFYLKCKLRKSDSKLIILVDQMIDISAILSQN